MQDSVSKFFDGIANNLNGLAANVQASISMSVFLDSTPHEKTMTIRRGGHFVTLPAYMDNDDISGTISIKISQTQKYEHTGLKVFLIGYLGTSPPTQKSSASPTSPPSSCSPAKNSNPPDSSPTTRPGGSSSLTSTRSTKASKVMPDRSSTSSEPL
jgi:hypothetical protein